MPNYLDYQKAMGLDWIHTNGYTSDTSQSSSYFKGSGVTIGIIDNGIQSGHSDIVSNFAGRFHGANILGDDESIASIQGYGLHGTHVAGIAAGAGSNEIYGVAPLAKLYDMPTIDLPPFYNPAIMLSKFKSSVDFAIDNNIKVLNCSFRMFIDDTENNPSIANGIRESIISAYNNNIIVCVAAGNSYGEEDYISDQGSFSTDIGTALNVREYILTVVALDEIDVYAGIRFPERSLSFGESVGKVDFSNYGKKRLGKNGISAPGTSIYSSVPINSYDLYDGTSMASPFIAGLAAMVIGFLIKAGIPVTAPEVFKIIKACVFHINYGTNPVNDSSNITYTNGWDENKIYIKGWNKYTGFGFTNFELISRVLMKIKNGGEAFTKQNLPVGKRGISTLPAGWPDIGPPPFTTPVTDADFT